MISQNGSFTFVYQTDGNAVIYRNNGYKAIWATNTVHTPGALLMQGDGNLVIYDKSGAAKWGSATNNKSGTKAPYRLVLQNDQNLVLYDSANKALWATNTVTTAPPPTATDKVTFFEDCDYVGAWSQVGVGSYDMAAMGVPNDTISSVRIPFGLKVTLYEHSFSGKSLDLFNSVPCLVSLGWNDTVSSFKISLLNCNE